MTPEMRQALDVVYDVFARYPTPNYLGLSGNFQLRDLTLENWLQLDKDYNIGVHLFSDAVLRYFLPRWLEWHSDEAVEFPSYEWELWHLACRLDHAKWRDWPADEVAALRAVFEIWARQEIGEYQGMPPAFWPREKGNLGEEGERLGLADFSADSELLRFLAGIGAAEPYLELWLNTNLPQLARWLWTENLQEHKAERHWLTTSRLESELEAAFFADAAGPNAELFSRSIELVRSLRA